MSKVKNKATAKLALKLMDLHLDRRYYEIGGEICQNCNQAYKTIYRVPDEIWQAVTGQKEGLLCIECFDELASLNGYKLLWQPEIHNVFE